MSAKWRALQHRHQYTYNSVVFPQSFIETLNFLQLETLPSSDFITQLKELTSLNSTYSQIAAAKNLSSAFTRLIADNRITESEVTTAATFYLEILFLENSLPLHRTLISALAKARVFLPVISNCLGSLCEEYSDMGKRGKKRFLVSRAALSLIGYPKLGFLNETVGNCATSVAADVVAGLLSVISDIDGGSRPSPVVMEQCQEAMSCLYYLLQRFPSRFVSSEEGSMAFEGVVRTIFTVLKSSAFPRDCLVAAGVSFWSSVQACLSPGELSSFISRGFFGFLGDDQEIGDLSMKKVLPNMDLYIEIKGLTVLSRICLLRGILTAIPRSVLNTCLIESSGGYVWTILYNGILPELCKYCENPVDSHFNFHALTVTQICLQQIKTSLLANLTDLSGYYDPLPDEMMGRILRIIWNNLEDPLSQTVKQVHLIFDLLLDISSTLPSGEGIERTKKFLCKNLAYLLHLGPRCKGRYSPLASLTKQLGAKHILHLNPNILLETIYAYADDDVCCAVTSFLKCFLECLRDECWSHDGIERGYEAFRGFCLPPLMQALVSGHSKLRSNLNTYALPVVLDVDSDSIFSMLAFISVGPRKDDCKFNVDLEIDQCVAAFVSLVKVSRMLALIEGDIELDNDSLVQQKSSDQVATICIKGVNVRVLVEWFILAVTHADESLRIDAAECLFLNPKTSSLPSVLELSLMREVVPLNMRCASTGFQMKWKSLFRKFFSRVRTALERQVKQGLWKPIACYDSSRNGLGDHVKDEVACRTEDLFHFMKWLSCFLLCSCYPSAPYERKIMAMELILIMIDVWPVRLTEGNHILCPYSEEFTSPDSTISLVGSVVDSWDRLRVSSFHILSCFPTPLPGISSHDSLNEVIRWAKQLVGSPRVRESDAGALTLRLIFRKYVLELGWMVVVSDNTLFLDSCSEPSSGDSQIPKYTIPVVEYISSLIEWLHVVIEAGEKDLSESCRNSFVHGVLLALRYTFEELDWDSDAVLSSSSEMRCLLQRLLELIMRVTSLALWVVSADAWYMPYDIDDMPDDDALLSEAELEIDTPESLSDLAEKNLKPDDNVRPAQHVVMVGCWLAMKEVSLLLGTIIRKVPLPSFSLPDSHKLTYPLCNADELEKMAMTDGLLNIQQLENIGNHFLQVLLKIKHNGAIDKTRAGFTALCNRLLCSNDPRLCLMTESWMERLMERTVAKGQTVDDLLRRSAGIPAAFIAFFLSEPEGTPKKLLPRALRWLIDVAMSLCNMCEASNLDCELVLLNSMKNPSEGQLETIPTEIRTNGMTSKIRDDGVIPTVHAFNALRAAFNDTNLAADTSGFCAEALTVSIRSFSSPYWEVRNSACLAYTALVRRMIGFLNIQKRQSARRSLTGLEFFHRYPTLHPFLFGELKIATEQLGDGCSRNMELNIVKAIHPSLCPILILLSRLKPSIISSGTDEAFDPFLFMPFIRKCATQSNLRVRVLASRALTGLVSNEKLQSVISGVAHDLPHKRSVDDSNENGVNGTHAVSFNYIHGVLLQLSLLLDNNCRNLTDITKKDQILGELIQLLLDCSWIGSINSCPCPTLNSSYLRVLDQMLSIATTSCHISTLQTLLMELASGCLEIGKVCRSLRDPTKIELCRQAATSYFSCLFAGNLEVSEGFPRIDPLTSSSDDTQISSIELHERIASCIFDSTHEVRIATLKWLLQVLKSITNNDDGVIYTWAKTNLQIMLMKLLAVDENPKCIYYVLKIIFSWNSRDNEKPIDHESVFCFWDKLVHLNCTVMRVKTREIILCCMGLCVKQFVRILQAAIFVDRSERNGGDESKGLWVRAYNCISFFINLVKQHSMPSEPVNMRYAAAEAMIASGLLEETSSIANNQIPSGESQVFEIEETNITNIEEPEVINLYSCRILDMWFTCIQLLEDEDVGLRERLAKDVQQFICSKGPKGSDNVPTQVEKVIESCFEFLSSSFGHWLLYLNYLATWVLNAARSVTSNGDLVRQIFDKEIDNHHEEKLLICQLCCSHLEKFLISKSSLGSEGINIETFFQKWRLRFLRQLIWFSNYLETEGRTNWIGGIGNHKDAFTSIYMNLLALYALTSGSDKGHRSSGQDSDVTRLYSSEFAKFVEVNRPFLKNPLICNLYFLVIRSHERYFAVTLAPVHRGECSAWKGFDPYFLLR